MTTAATIDFPVFDADSHVLEPAEVWTKHLEPEYRVPARSVFWREDGPVRPAVFLNGRLARTPFIPDGPAANIPREGVWRVGMDDDAIGRLDPKVRHPVNPGGSDPGARLQDMDVMGIDQALLFPTYFNEYLPLVENPDIAAALARAYNNWIVEFSKAAPDRLYPSAVLPMQDINAAVVELRRAVKLGMKAVAIRPVFVGGRFVDDPYYYPLWKEIEDLGVVFASHPAWGTATPELDSNAPFVERVASHLKIGYPVAESIAPMMDQGVLLLGMMTEGLLEQFPKLKFYFAHSKASWLHLLLEKAESYLWLAVRERPVDLEPEVLFFERATRITFDANESAVWEMPDLFVHVAAFGSLYPNHDTSTPRTCIDNLRRHDVPDATVRRLMSDNIASLLGVNVRKSAKRA